jgi:hypothetical protein
MNQSSGFVSFNIPALVQTASVQSFPPYRSNWVKIKKAPPPPFGEKRRTLHTLLPKAL